MYYITRDLLLWCHTQGIRLREIHIKGTMNVMADLLSRDLRTVNTEWSLHPQVAQQIWNKWYMPKIDLFATLYNRKQHLYVSPFPDQEAMAIDALSLNWDHLNTYAFPPTAILKEVTLKLEQSIDCNMILVAPYWPNQTWFPILQNLSVEPPFQLPNRYDLLRQPIQEIYHQSLEMLNLHAWLLYKAS